MEVENFYLLKIYQNISYEADFQVKCLKWMAFWLWALPLNNYTISPEMNVLTQKQNMQARKPHTYAYAEFLEARCMFEIGFFRWVKLWGQ